MYACDYKFENIECTVDEDKQNDEVNDRVGV